MPPDPTPALFEGPTGPTGPTDVLGPSSSPTERLADFLVHSGAMLLAHACPSHRTEDILTDVARRFGYVADVFSVPSAIWLGLARPGQPGQIIRIARVGAWALSLEKLAAVDAVFDELISGRIDLEAAEKALSQVTHRPREYGPVLEWVAGALASAAAVLLYGGRLFEALMGAGIGLGFTVLSGLFAGRHDVRHLTPFFFGALATALAWLASYLEPELATQPLIVAGVILFVPGVTLTIGLHELVQKNLISGTGRLLDATMTLMSIVFGVMLVAAIAHGFGASTLFLTKQHEIGADAPELVLATAVAGAAFSVLVGVPRRYLPAALGSCLAAGIFVEAAQLRFAQASLSAFFGALATGLYANMMARWTRRPAQLFLVPGIVLLVPGTFGFLSFGKLFEGDVTGGASGAFQTLMVGAALATGIVVANAALPPRKAL